MIDLQPMSDEQYEAFSQYSVKNYAEGLQESQQISHDDAFEVAQKSFDGLAPEGLKTPNQHFYNLIEVESGKHIGTVWLTEKQMQSCKRVYITDIVIFEEFRGQGFGGKVMQVVEAKARELNAHDLMLSVFDHNEVAKKLYEKAGLKPRSILMSKTLCDS